MLYSSHRSITPATPYDDGDMEKETTPQTKATPRLSSIAMLMQESAEAGKLRRKRRFVEIVQKHGLDISQVAEEAKIPEEVVYYLLLNLPVNRYDFEDIVEAVDVLTGARYQYSDLEYVVSTLDEREWDYMHRRLSRLPFHRVTLDGESIYSGFDWREASRQFFEALARSGGKRVVSHSIQAPPVPATCARARASALPK